jgi:hypothetical protein
LAHVIGHQRVEASLPLVFDVIENLASPVPFINTHVRLEARSLRALEQHLSRSSTARKFGTTAFGTSPNPATTTVDWVKTGT